MKIFILKTPHLLQPATQLHRYPVHNKDYGIEQDFFIWLKKQQHLLTQNPDEANWHYLPVYWTRWHINHKFGEDPESLQILQQEVNKVMLDPDKTFTIVQFDGGTLLNLGKTIEFTAGKTTNSGIDVPMLCSPHRKPLIRPEKKYLASFNGSFSTHPVRREMQLKYAGNKDILVDGLLPTRFYKRWFWGLDFNLNMMAAYVALCPRGTDATSFRFFEAMQFGVAPCLISDQDVRPFKKFIRWDEMSYYVSSVDELDHLLKNLDKKEALEKGKKAYKYWKNELYYQRWCKYVIKELEQIS